MSDVEVSEPLAALAEAHGVATVYTDADERSVAVTADTVRAVLGAMGVEASDDEAARCALDAWRAERDARLLPRIHLMRRGRAHTRTVQCRELDDAALVLEDGATRQLSTTDPVMLPDDLPLGYHRLHGRGGGREDDATVVVAPERCPLPPARAWGVMAQLYQLRSQGSWGMGDAADLRELASRAGADLGAGFVVCNPLHAVTPVAPVQPSPYFPSSRRFANPLYLRLDDIPEIGHLPGPARERYAELAASAEALNHDDRIDYDAIWRHKLAALELVYAAPRGGTREAAFRAYRDRAGRGLTDFATFCALAEQHGLPWQRWPTPLRHPDRPEVAAARDALAERVDFHVWLQWLLDEQLATAQHAATTAGMAIGVVHDLAVGVDPGGADAWALQDELAGDVRVGAPPDAFNQLGQNWAQPPLRPDRLAATAMRPFRDMLANVLAHAGGVRIDHVLGLFRLYWIPEGAPATDGTYVRYPASALLGVLALEAERAGAVVVGEDLGTVEEGVRDRLADTGVLGSRVLYFQRRADGNLADPSAYPELALASVTTHDLPTAAGWWRDEAVDVKVRLGLLGAGRSEADERAASAAQRAEMRALLQAHGLVGEDASIQELVVAMHAFLARTPCRLVAVSPADAIGDVRQPNMPGTTDEYPNWRLPLAEPTSEGPRPAGLEHLLAHPRLHELARLLTPAAVDR